MKNKWLLAALVFIGSFPAVGDESWEEIMPGVNLAYPRDHGSHPNTRTEWWYATGQVEDQTGRKFGYQFTIFRNGVIAGKPPQGESSFKARHVLAGHFAIADIEAKTFVHAERLRRIGGGIAGASEQTLRSWIGDWEIRLSEEGRIHLSASDVSQGIEMAMALTPAKPLVLQGDRGYSAKGIEPGNASAYASFTRLQTEGTLTIGGSSHPVSGLSWFDHEYGTSQLGENVAGWDWFGMHLDDGRDLMVYRLRSTDGAPTAQSSGTVIEADGASHRLAHQDFSMTPLAYWKSKATGGRYPLKWKIEIPGHGIDLVAAALIEPAEMDTRESTGVVYWEGPVAASGKTPGQGYMELTGYGDTLEARF